MIEDALLALLGAKKISTPEESVVAGQLRKEKRTLYRVYVSDWPRPSSHFVGYMVAGRAQGVKA